MVYYLIAMANQELYKLENAVRKAESAWDRQMKRDGHLKKESRDISTADSMRMSPTARAFFHEYQAAKQKLDDEANRTDLFGGTPADPADLGGGEDDEDDEKKSKPRGKKPKLQVVTGNYPRPDEVLTPEGLDRRIISPQLMDDWRKLSAAESLTNAKPTAKVIPYDEQHWVVTEVGEGYVVLNRCIPEDRYEGNTIANLEGRAAGDWDGLLFRSGAGRSPMFVLLNSAQAIACVAGDPLASVKLSGTDD